MKKIIIPIIIIVLIIGVVIIISLSKANSNEIKTPTSDYVAGIKISDIVRDEIANKLSILGINIEKTKSNNKRNELGNGETYIIKNSLTEETINIYMIDNNIHNLLDGNTTSGEKEIDGKKYWIYKNLIISLPLDRALSDSLKKSLV